MSTHVISCLGPQTIPDTTGSCFFNTFDQTATNDLFKHMVVQFIATPSTGAEYGIYGTFRVPQNYVGTAAIIPDWTSATTTGNARWEFSYRAVGGDDAESLDQTTFQEEVQVTDAAPSAAFERNTPSLALTSGNLAAGDTVEFYFKRSKDGNDTIGDSLTLHDLNFSYADA